MGYKGYNSEFCDDIYKSAERVDKLLGDWLYAHRYGDLERYFTRDPYHRYRLIYNIPDDVIEVVYLSDNLYIQNTVDLYWFPNGRNYSNAVFDINIENIINELYDSGEITKEDKEYLLRLLKQYGYDLINELYSLNIRLYNIISDAIRIEEDYIMLESVWEQLKNIKLEDIVRMIKEQIC